MGRRQGGMAREEERRLGPEQARGPACAGKVHGRREVEGKLKGFDTLVNLVLDECVEYMRDVDDPYKLTDEQRQLGLIVCRGTAVTLVCPCDGMMEIANPFLQE